MKKKQSNGITQDIILEDSLCDVYNRICAEQEKKQDAGSKKRLQILYDMYNKLVKFEAFPSSKKKRKNNETSV